MRERIARIEITPRQFELLAYAALAALTLIVATGAAVRLSDSGLGCPDWRGVISMRAMRSRTGA